MVAVTGRVLTAIAGHDRSETSSQGQPRVCKPEPHEHLAVVRPRPNANQLSNSDSDTGAFWADNADRFDAGVAAYREPFLAAAAIEGSTTVLDVGCGSGQLTRDAARLATEGEGSALGVDLSSRMVELARRRAHDEQLTNVTFEQPMHRSTPLPASNSIWPSAGTGRCSSATRSPRSATSRGRCAPAGGWCC